MPWAEVAAQEGGTTLWAVEFSPHEAGLWFTRRAAAAVRKEAWLHVRAAAERGVPLRRENCSARRPVSDGVYFSTMPMYPSA